MLKNSDRLSLCKSIGDVRKFSKFFSSYITLYKFCYVLGRGRFFSPKLKIIESNWHKIMSKKWRSPFHTKLSVSRTFEIFSKFAIFCTWVTPVHSNSTKRCLIVRFSPKRINSDQKSKIKHHLAFLETKKILPVLKHSDCPLPV